VPANLNPCGTAIAAPAGIPGDYDRQFRPQVRIPAQAVTTWDLGADEIPSVPLLLFFPFRSAR
jgi:hypothetical protein